MQKIDMIRDMIAFGTYAVVYVKITNKLRVRSVPEISLFESNSHGGQYFMSLYTGKG